MWTWILTLENIFLGGNKFIRKKIYAFITAENKKETCYSGL
jgi:hypothetical protein